MFAPYDTNWQDRECLLTVQGREYVGMLKTPEKGQEYLRCNTWDTVAAKVAKYNPWSRISDEYFPGFKSSLNRMYCRNPGGIWSQPGCFLQYPSNREEEKRKAASCGVPLCPVLTQFRSSPAGMEYGGQLDLRKKTGCVDKCKYRHTLLGPACTLKFYEELLIKGTGQQMTRKVQTKKWEVYYPCDVPLMDGETLTLRADIAGVPEGWNIFTPITWYLTPGKFINLRKGGEGRMFLRLPQDLFNEGRETSLRFHVRLGDPMDVNDFEFQMSLSPDTSLLEAVVITIDIYGLHLVHVINKAYVLQRLYKVAAAETAVPWATLMYRWLDLEVTIRNKNIKVEVFGAEKNEDNLH